MEERGFYSPESKLKQCRSFPEVMASMLPDLIFRGPREGTRYEGGTLLACTLFV